jgi:hypothetical protein
MMNITLLNPLSGEIHEVQLPVGCEIYSLETLLYREIYPDSALGTIEIRRAITDNEDDEVLQLMIMGESLTDQDPNEVTLLFDGIQIIAFVNPFLLKPSVIRESCVNVHLKKTKKSVIRPMNVINVSFHHPTKMITEESNVITSVELLHDAKKHHWALYSTCKTGRGESSWDLFEVYPTKETIWFSSLSECLVHTEERIPKHAEMFEQIERLFREAMQEDHDEEDDDWRREEDDAWGRAVDARERWYEDHIRWQ